jgi:GTP diphosphokinase / guanosine-3',5'-bis(diphosphate) 3'-diphosphatase
MPTGQEISQEEITHVTNVFESFLSEIKGNMTLDDEINIRKAYELAVDAHKYQRRKSGEPYIHHPIAVARICTNEIGLGPTAVICALLHDVVEDTEVSLNEINELFGPKISRIVDGLTKLDGLYNVESPQAENFKKVLSTLIHDVRVVIIKLADRLHNLRTIGSMPIHKKLKIAAETEYIFIPLAHRLGLYEIKTELQDIVLSIKDPEEYAEIKQKLAESEVERQDYIDSFINPLVAPLDSLGIKYRILGRPKAISSVYNKIKNKGVPFEEIYDIFAVRVIADVPLDQEKLICWQIYSKITEEFRPIPERLKDWVSTPKSNGYESLHTTVIGPKGKYVEVQIRSERMNEIAEKGFAAHWKYKGVKSQNNVFDNWLDSVRGMLEEQDSNALEFVNEFKNSFFSEGVYVYTPKGEMRILPQGATALDFAFEIHTDVGMRAYAIKVNGKPVHMSSLLKNGDQVHVTTKVNQRPQKEWLNNVVTAKAKSKIRSSLRDDLRVDADLGKEILERKLKSLRIGFEDNVDFLVRQYGYHSRLEFFYGLYHNEFTLDLKVFDIDAGIIGNKKVEVTKETAKIPELKRPRKKLENKSKILVNGEPGDKYEFKIANCCNPVQGESIFGYLTSTNELKIHRYNCPNASWLLSHYGYRVLKTEWDSVSEESFVTNLKITGVDTGVGVIQMLTNTISNDLGINIKGLNIQGKEGYYEGFVTIFVKNKDQLNQVVKKITQLDGVRSVERYEIEES